jgi:antibiotic biosynthesis monooxygenase (ABM) superfamily enzyme
MTILARILPGWIGSRQSNAFLSDLDGFSQQLTQFDRLDNFCSHLDSRSSQQEIFFENS